MPCKNYVHFQAVENIFIVQIKDVNIRIIWVSNLICSNLHWQAELRETAYNDNSAREIGESSIRNIAEELLRFTLYRRVSIVWYLFINAER